jgi:hypothetical protein
MGGFRLWLFRVLVAIAASLMIASFTMPWWIGEITHEIMVGLHGIIEVHSYGLNHNLVELAEFLAADETPVYQTVLAWIYLVVSVGIILFSTWLKGNKGRWLLGGIGLIYIAYAAIAAFMVIANRTADVGIPMQGVSTFQVEGGGFEVQSVIISTGLQFGYYLAYAAGGLCLALALFRDIIVGKSIRAT